MILLDIAGNSWTGRGHRQKPDIAGYCLNFAGYCWILLDCAGFAGRCWVSLHLLDFAICAGFCWILSSLQDGRHAIYIEKQ